MATADSLGERVPSPPADPREARLSSPAEITIERRVSWMDTDAAGIYHWTTAFRFAEDAEAALHTALGIAEETFGLTPRLAVEATFTAPVAFNDPVTVHFAVMDVGRSSVRYRFEITHDGADIMHGALAACFLDAGTRRATPWSERVRRALRDGGPQQEAR